MRKKILILDDDPFVLDILETLLDYEGFDSVLVENTHDLFGLVRLHRPALILLDFRLNGRDGGSWCALLKGNPEFADIPVIIFTAWLTAIEKGSYGCNDFIAKPFDIEDIITRIKTLTEDIPECRYYQEN